MAKDASIYTRVEPHIKEQAEQILARLGIPMSNAIALFLHQVILQKGIPFEAKLPQRHSIDYSTLTDERFNAEMEKGFTDLNDGRVVSSETVRENMKSDYGV